MSTFLIFLCFCFAIKSHAEIINSNKKISLKKLVLPQPFNLDEELKKISSTRLTNRDYELLVGNNMRAFYARLQSAALFRISSTSICVDELRETLHFSPRGPWKPYHEPSEDELKSASNIEAYYDLIEPFSYELNPYNPFFYEKNVNIAVAFIDQRVPSIRTIYKRRFEEMHRLNNGLIDRQSVKRMIVEAEEIRKKIDKSIEKMREPLVLITLPDYIKFPDFIQVNGKN